MTLHFNGMANDFFVFNISNTYVATNIGWNFTGSGQGVTFNSGVNVLATFLVNSNTAPECDDRGNQQGQSIQPRHRRNGQ